MDSHLKKTHHGRSLHSLLGIPEEANPGDYFKEIFAKQNMLRKNGLIKEAVEVAALYWEARVIFSKKYK